MTNNAFTITQLTSVTITFNISNVIHTVYANSNRFDKIFDGIKNKINLTDSLQNTIVSFLQPAAALGSSQNVTKLFDFRTLTSITIVRSGALFTLFVRAPTSYYKSSSGLLVNGCQTSGQSQIMTPSPVCITACQSISAFQPQIAEINSSTIYNLCTQYCSMMVNVDVGKLNLLYAQLIALTIDQRNDDYRLALVGNTIGNCKPTESLTCNCQFGYTSQYCNMRADMCLSKPCKNGGKCTNLETPGLYVRISISLFFSQKCKLL